MAKFSVIVPVYNAENTIERCVDSIVRSGGTDVEIILVEDCSKDHSWDVCLQLAEKYENVCIFRNDKNQGVSFTRNRALDHATGEYLLFVDSDDWVEDKYVGEFSKIIDERNAQFAICGYINHDEKHSGRTDVIAWNDFNDVKQVPLRFEIENLHARQLLQQLWNKVFENAVVKENDIRFDETISIGEDTRFILDYIKYGKIQQVHLINQPLYHYMRDQDGSLMFRVGYESVEEPLKNLRKMYEIKGMSQIEIETRIAEDRQRQIENYSYLIMHNMGMPHKEKRRLILNLDTGRGKKLYRQNLITYWKERIAILFKKIGFR